MSHEDNSAKAIAVASASFSRSPLLLQELKAIGFPVIANERGAKFDRESLFDFLSPIAPEVLVVGPEPIDGRILDQLKSIRLVVKYGVGLDNVDIDEFAKRNVRFAWTAGVNKRSVAELVLAFMLGHTRNVFATMTDMKAGIWTKKGGVDLSACVVGIVGFGFTGTEVAKLLRGFQNEILCCDILDKRREATELGAKQCSFEEVLQKSDVISFHVPADSSTMKMFGSKAIEYCKAQTLVINTSRGSVVDFEVVVDAVRAGRLGGFASDVYVDEPFDGAPYRQDRNIYLTPHIGGNSHQAVVSMGRAVIGHIKEYFKFT